MAPKDILRDSRLIDALDALPRKAFEGAVWRVVRESRNPLQCSASGGRWDDGSFDALYTSRDRDGAIAEMYFHLLRGQPVFPSKLRYVLYQLNVSLTETMILAMEDLIAFGLDATRYGLLSYHERNQEYPRSQEIGEVAHFLDCDGLLVPNARWDCSNLILFCDNLKPDSMEVVVEYGPIDWAAWQKAHKR